MNHKDFISETICNLSQQKALQLYNTILKKYISFEFIKCDNFSQDDLAEKMYDYFVTLEIKTNQSFDKQIESYMNDLNSIVSPWIEKTPQQKRGDTVSASVPRSRKYYEKALSIKVRKNLSLRNLLDYSRIMMCLYTEINKQDHKVINNFNYASDCLNPIQIIDFMNNEEIAQLLVKEKRKKFNTKDKFNSDACTLILASILLYTIIHETKPEESENE